MSQQALELLRNIVSVLKASPPNVDRRELERALQLVQAALVDRHDLVVLRLAQEAYAAAHPVQPR